MSVPPYPPQQVGGVTDHALLTNVLFTQHHTHGGLYNSSVRHISTEGFGGSTTANLRPCLAVMHVLFKVTIDQLFYVVGAASAGNARMGVYPDNGGAPDGEALTVQSSIGAVPGVSRFHFLALAANTTINPGKYWIGVMFDGGVASMDSCTEDANLVGLGRRFNAALGAHVFPTPCPATTLNTNFLRGAGFRIFSTP